MEMVATLFKKLLEGATREELITAGFGGYYANHETCPFYLDGGGSPWTATYTQAKGEPIADLYNDLAADGATLYKQHFLRFFTNVEQ